MTQTSSYSMNSVKLQQQEKWKAIFKTLERRQTCSTTEKARIDKKNQIMEKIVLLILDITEIQMVEIKNL